MGRKLDYVREIATESDKYFGIERYLWDDTCIFPLCGFTQVCSSGENRSVGLADAQVTISGYLMEGKEELDFISIIGMPGLGKTTLARRIYQSQLIQYEFPTRIWVNVSQDFKKKDVFIHILREVSSKDMSAVSADESASAVHHFLARRKFLLVLDDVWALQHFFAIRAALPEYNRSSKVLLTSPFEKIGEYANPAISPHKLGFLNDADSRELLQLEVFGGISPPELTEIGQHIAGG